MEYSQRTSPHEECFPDQYVGSQECNMWTREDNNDLSSEPPKSPFLRKRERERERERANT